MKTGYIIDSNGKIIGLTTSRTKAGTVQVAYARTKEEINANRDYNLVNAFDAKLSYAKKYSAREYQDQAAFASFADELNDREFYIKA